MKIVKVYNVFKNEKFVNATVEYKNFLGKVKKRNIFYEEKWAPLMKWSDTSHHVGSLHYSIYNECLNQLQNKKQN